MFSPDALAGFYGGYSVTYQNLQLAAYLGLNPIYLVGCDHSYSGETDQRKVRRIRAGRAKNHFIRGYREEQEAVNAAPIERMTIAFEHARHYAEHHGITICNATRGGHLDVFDRVDLDGLLQRISTSR